MFVSVSPDHQPGNFASASLVGLRILLIEDSWIVAQSYAALLDNLGAEVLGPVVTVAEALRLIKDGPIDVALVDMELQGELAFEVVDELALREIPAVVVTGLDVAEQLGGKARAFLRKPIRVEALIKELRAIAAHR